MGAFVEDALKMALPRSTIVLDKLGVSLEDLAGQVPGTGIRAILNAIADEETDETTKGLALAHRRDPPKNSLARGCSTHTPNEGADGIEKLRQEAHDLGIVFDQEGADSAAAMSDSMTRLKATFGKEQRLGLLVFWSLL